MPSMREHLTEFHGKAAAHHDAKAAYHDSREQSHTKHAAIHKTMHKSTGMAESPHLSLALLHEQDAVLHKTAAAHHREHADFHRTAMEACAKGVDSGDLTKREGLVPTNVSRVAPERPTITPVLRHGQREIATSVAPEFSKILGTDQESMHTDEPSLRQ